MPNKVDLKKLRSLDEDDEEYDDLLVDRRVEMALAIPRPTCCPAAQAYPAVTFSVVYHEGDSGTNEGSWQAHLHSGLLREFAHSVDWFKNTPPAKFCPYCGTPLPKMQRVDKPDVCRVSDGGYYCDTCKERLSNCLCDPPEAGFRAGEGTRVKTAEKVAEGGARGSELPLQSRPKKRRVIAYRYEMTPEECADLTTRLIAYVSERCGQDRKYDLNVLDTLAYNIPGEDPDGTVGLVMGIGKYRADNVELRIDDNALTRQEVRICRDAMLTIRPPILNPSRLKKVDV